MTRSLFLRILEKTERKNFVSLNMLSIFTCKSNTEEVPMNDKCGCVDSLKTEFV